MSQTDGFLDGRLKIHQPRHGYRAGSDPVFLAASIDATPGQRVLELGCGVGVAMICLMSRIKGLCVTGIERDPDLAELARANTKENDMEARILTADLANLPPEIRAENFDHVFANPPYFDRRAGPPASHAGREAGRGEETPLAQWVDAGVRRLAPGGKLTIIQKASRLDDVLGAFDTRLGDILIIPLAPRIGRPAGLTIVTARKGARGPLTLLAPLILHDGAFHDGDKDSYSAPARAVLRDGKGLKEAGFILK